MKVREAARVLGREGEVARAITDPEKKIEMCKINSILEHLI